MLRDSIGQKFVRDKHFVNECYGCGTNDSKAWCRNHGTKLSLCTYCYDRLRQIKGIGAKQKLAKKECYACGSTKTYIQYGKRPMWIINCDRDNNVLCKVCYDKYIGSPRWWANHKGKKILFKDKQIYLKENPKTGVCKICNRTVQSGKIKYTNIHHIEYHEDDPLRDTIELCVNCHNKQHPERYRR